MAYRGVLSPGRLQALLRRGAHRGSLIAQTLGAIAIAVGCGGQPDPADACVAADTQAIYHGSSDAPGLETAVERAVGAIYDEFDRVQCSGTLIDADRVLTAGHCDVPGSLQFRSNELSFDVETRTLHPELDLMLMSVVPRGPSAAVEPIVPWDEAIGPEWVGSLVTLAGLGESEDGSEGQRRFVDEPIVDVTEQHVVVDGRGRSGACAGDSGGPLLFVDQLGRTRLIGVLSKGARNCVGVDYYTRTDEAEGWLALDRTVAPRCH